MPNVRGGAGTGFGGAASAGRNSDSSSRAARSGESVGGTKKAGNATVADHLVATGAISTPSIPSNGVARGNYPTQDDAYNDYSKAVGDWSTRNFGNRLADFLAGPLYDENEPMAGNPRSFGGGRFHSSSNPAGLVAGLLSPFGSGMITGPLISRGYNALGGPNVWHGGLEQPDVRNGIFGNSTADMGQSFGDMNGGGSLLGGGVPGSQAANNQSPSGNQTNGGALLSHLANINAPVSGNPSAPQSVGPAAATPTSQPNWQQIASSMQQVTPNYGVSLPGYQYRRGPIG